MSCSDPWPGAHGSCDDFHPLEPSSHHGPPIRPPSPSCLPYSFLAPREIVLLRTFRRDEDGTYIVLYQVGHSADYGSSLQEEREGGRVVILFWPHQIPPLACNEPASFGAAVRMPATRTLSS